MSREERGPSEPASVGGINRDGTESVRRTIRLGLRANLGQFSLLVVVNAFVGAMVGLERTVLPLIADHEFGLASKSAVLSFIVSFGLVKALANLLTGRWSDRVGRKKLLVVGWLIGLPVPLIVMWAPAWGWVVAANVLLGVNQGICWSTTVIMKIDLVGPARRGLAMGLNEFAGYLAVALSALATGYIAGAYGLRPEPFYLGIAIAVLGLGSSVFLVRETRHHAAFEARFHQPRSVDETNTTAPSFRQIFALATWKDRTLFNCSQVGLVNNLNDGMAWGLFPLLFALEGLSVDRIGILAATYPAVWGMTQLCTGVLSDRWGRKWLIVWGMWVQAVGIVTIVAVHGWASWITGSVLLGVGTAMVYPTLLAAVSDVAPPQWRASAVGVYRLWRDLGYAVGAVISGILADRLGLGWAIGAIAGLTFLSGTVAALFMPAARPAAFKAQVHQIKE